MEQYLYLKIKQETLAHLQRTEVELGEYQPFYVPLLGKHLEGKDEEEQDLADLLQTHFLTKDTVGSALLLGSSGAGKTSFARQWVKQCWLQSHYNEKPLMALWIPLLSIDQPKNYLLSKHLENNLNLTKSEIQAFLQSPMQLLVCCDGYDELNTQDNLYPTEMGKPIELKVLYTCRPEVVEHQRNYRLSFNPPLGSQKQLLEYEVVPFQAAQRLTFIEQYLQHNQLLLPESLENQPNWRKADTYLQYLNQLPEVDQFLSHPFALLMALQALPTIVKEQSVALSSSENNTNTNQSLALTGKQLTLTRQKIYSVFIDKWWDWQIKKVEARKELNLLIHALQDEIHTRQAKKQHKGQAIEPTEAEYPESTNQQMEWLKRELNHFTRKLALAMFQRKVNEVTWKEEVAPAASKFQLASLSSAADKPQDAWQKRYFANKPGLNLIRRCLPLQRLGLHTYAFLHKSLLEYFAAEQLFNSVIVSVWAELGKNLDAICLVNTNDSETRELLVEQVRASTAFEQALWEIIELSKSEPRVWRAAANAMTLLNLAGKSFSGKDLRRVHIGGEDGEECWGADLTRAILDSVDLTEADLRYVRLDHSWLAQAKLNRAIMLGVEFGELPWLRGKLSCYSPDGQWLAVIEEEIGALQLNITRTIALYRTADYHLVRRFNALHKENINCLSFSPDSKQLATCSGYQSHDLKSKENFIRLWDVTTGKCHLVLQEHTHPITSISYRPDGLQLASGSEDDTIRLWEVSTGKCQQVLKVHRSYWMNSGVMSVSYCPDGLQLASGGKDKTIRLWDIATGKCMHILQSHTDNVLTVNYHPGGLQLASGGKDKTIRLWDIVTGKCMHILQSHTDNVLTVNYHPGGLQLASGGKDKTIRLWDIVTGKCMHILQSHTDNVLTVNYHPGGLQLASGGKDKTIRLWDIVTGKCMHILQSHTDNVLTVNYHPGGLQLASGEWHGTIRLWDIQTGQCQQVLKEHTPPVTSINYRPDGLQLASGSGYYNYETEKGHGTISLWDVRTGKCQQVLKGHSSPVKSFSYRPDGLQLASSGTFDETIWLWDVISGKCQQVLQQPEYYLGSYSYQPSVSSVSYRPDGLQLAASSSTYGPPIQLWDVSTGKCQQVLQGDTFSNNDVIIYRPDGLQLASAGSSDGTIQLWEVSTGKCQQVLKGHTSNVNSLSYRPDGLQLASGSFGRTIRLWQVSTGRCQKVLKGHTEWVYSICYRPDGSQLASGSGDNTIRLWDTRTGQCLVIISCNSTVTSLSWQPADIHTSPEAYFLTAGCWDGTLKTWQIKSINNHINYQLVASYPTVYELLSYDLELQGVIGLKGSYYQLLQQRGGNTVKGQPSKADPQQVIQQRNQQKYVPSGTITVKGGSGVFTITPQHWLISLVREKSDRLQASPQGSTDGHAYIILQGLDEQHYTIVKEFHLYLNTQKFTLFNALGTGVIKIHDSSPWMLKEKQERLIAQQWMISCTAANALIERIEQQQKSKAPSYSVSGKGGHNCLSWCVKQLEDADIPINSQPTWRSFICAVPSDYLPEVAQANNNNQDRNCLVM